MHIAHIWVLLVYYPEHGCPSMFFKPTIRMLTMIISSCIQPYDQLEKYSWQMLIWSYLATLYAANHRL